MIIGGLQKLTLLDYPDHVAAIIFTQGCNFRCHYCYNPKLVVPNNAKNPKDYSQIDEDGLFGFLKSRQGKLDAVVVTGGEPTLHNDLPQFLQRIKDLGFLIKLDTNGTNPELIKSMLDKSLIDYIAMDIKAPLEYYEHVVGVSVPLNNIKNSIIIIKNSSLPYEFRSTIMPALHSVQHIQKMGEMIQGAERWYLQKFKSNTELVDGQFKNKPFFSDQEMHELAQIARSYVKFVGVR